MTATADSAVATDRPAPIRTPWTERVGVDYPLLQDGMGGGALGTGRLAAAVSNAGALGSLSSPGTTSGEELNRIMREQIDTALSLTDKPIAVNIPVGSDHTGKILPYSKEILDIVKRVRENESAAQRQIVLVTTSAGMPGEFSKWVRDLGLLHQHKVGAPKHAVKAVEAGADFVIASGAEMGGHTLATPISTMVLAPEVIDTVDVPVLVSGGFKDGRGLAAMLAAGAAGIGMGTRFMVTQENDWNDNYIDRVLAAKVEESIVVPGVYGPCRYIKGKATDELLELLESGSMSEGELTAWKEKRSHMAQRDGDVENGFTTAGMVAGYITDRPTAQELVDRIVSQAHQLLAKAAGL